MAKKKFETGTAAIYDYLNRHPDAKPKEIKTELAKEGADVSDALVQKAKRKWKLEREGQAPKKAATKKAAEPTAATDKVNKSEEIRKYLRRHRGDVSPKAVSETLTRKLGVDVKPQTVSQIKSDMAKKKQPAKSAAKAAPATKTTPAAKTAPDADMESAVESLLAAKALADRLGGVDRAKQVLNMLAKLK